MKNILLLLALFAATANGLAQQFFYAGNTSVPTVIQLKWTRSSPKFNVEFDIYRTVKGEKNWKKINNKPIRPSDPAQLSPDKNANSADWTMYQQFRSLTFNNKNDQRMAEIGFYGQAILNNNLARYAGLYYKDEAAIVGKTYVYMLVVSDGTKKLPVAFSEPIMAGAFQALKAPEGLATQSGNRTVTLTWKRSDNFMFYHVFRKKGYEKEIQLTKKPLLVPDAVDGKEFTPSYTDMDTTLKGGMAYGYRIVGIDYFGNMSEYSAPSTAFVRDLTPPQAAQEVTAVKKGNKAVITWKPSLSPKCIGYNVYRSFLINGSYVKLNTSLLPLGTVTFEDLIQNENLTHHYYIEAVDDFGNKGVSNIARIIGVDTTPPVAPVVVDSKTGKGFVSIRWRANTEKDVLGYRVYRSIANDAESFNLIHVKPIRQTAFLDSLPQVAQNRFYYKITAVDSAYNESTGTILVLKMPDIVAPQAPILNEAVLEKGKVQLQWEIPPALDLKGFTVLRRTVSDTVREFTKITTALLSPKSASYTDASVQSGIGYEYALMAVDSSDNYSKRSVSKSVYVSKSENLSIPQLLTADYDSSARVIKIHWRMAEKTAGARRYLLKKENEGNFMPILLKDEREEYLLREIEPNSGEYRFKLRLLAENGTLAESNELKITIR
jgi:hypothetical protein